MIRRYAVDILTHYGLLNFPRATVLVDGNIFQWIKISWTKAAHTFRKFFCKTVHKLRSFFHHYYIS